MPALGRPVSVPGAVENPLVEILELSGCGRGHVETGGCWPRLRLGGVVEVPRGVGVEDGVGEFQVLADFQLWRIAEMVQFGEVEDLMESGPVAVCIMKIRVVLFWS